MSAAIRHRIIRVLEAKTQMDLWALLVGFDGGKNRGQYTDKDESTLDADELAKRLGR